MVGLGASTLVKGITNFPQPGMVVRTHDDKIARDIGYISVVTIVGELAALATIATGVNNASVLLCARHITWLSCPVPSTAEQFGQAFRSEVGHP